MKRYRNNVMKLCTLTIFQLVLGLTGVLWSQTSPVSANLQLSTPPSIFLPDYYAMGGKELSITLNFNDFNEPSTDVFIRLRIEGQKMSIRTKTDFQPASITLLPGVPTVLSGEALSPYLTFENINIAGSSTTEFSNRGGKIPEGFYSFFVDIHNAQTGKLILSSPPAIGHIT
ncbi:MAG: hypothetical protein MI922_16500, partial [Bacteroidales bacterium]|nr:hypothetical protein [Bacteroidales bacterium]